jgi:hypothetical protein
MGLTAMCARPSFRYGTFDVEHSGTTDRRACPGEPVGNNLGRSSPAAPKSHPGKTRERPPLSPHVVILSTNAADNNQR